MYQHTFSDKSASKYLSIHVSKNVN